MPDSGRRSSRRYSSASPPASHHLESLAGVLVDPLANLDTSPAVIVQDRVHDIRSSLHRDGSRLADVPPKQALSYAGPSPRAL